MLKQKSQFIQQMIDSFCIEMQLLTSHCTDVFTVLILCLSQVQKYFTPSLSHLLNHKKLYIWFITISMHLKQYNTYT